MKGGTTTLQCKVDQPDALTSHLSWEECITKGDGTCRRISNDNDMVYELLGGDPVRGARYSVNNPEAKQFDLQITGVLPEDAGRYRCLSSNDNTKYRYAEIITLGEYC